MSVIEDRSPQAEVARQFMAHKGISIEPYDVESLEGQPCHYFLYRLPEGTLELEVFYDQRLQEWQTTVTSFGLAV